MTQNARGLPEPILLLGTKTSGQNLLPAPPILEGRHDGVKPKPNQFFGLKPNDRHNKPSNDNVILPATSQMSDFFQMSLFFGCSDEQ
ncbi:MAG TPA: hypothetical protein DCF63_19600 [Planctomycetaceae bacterium]|nr:hypothetical protein [Planctomycetaceae bacterium]